MDEQLLAAVAAYHDPILDRPLVSVGEVRAAERDGNQARIALKLGIPADRFGGDLVPALGAHLRETEGVESLKLDLEWAVAAQPVQPNLKPMDRVGNIIAVASGKGGVGKSTTTVNLALALASEGARVGVLDADIYGPSQPRMLGLSGQRPTTRDGKRIDPLVGYGIRCMSIGFLISEDEPMVWRGPMVTSALVQMMNDTEWGDLDYLLVDMPPGTGDIQLTLSQQVPVSGAVIVTTPQDIALLDAKKGLAMFRKVQVPVLGIVENMSTHVCTNCGHEEPVFGSGGGASMASQYEVPLLGGLPLDIRIRAEADEGNPSVVADPDGAPARAYVNIARRMAAALAAQTSGAGGRIPTITIEDD